MTMRAMIVEELGEPEVFKSATVPRPEIKPGHLLIRVEATSVNPLDCKLRSIQLPFSSPLPAVLHGDIAGVVEAVGEGVTAAGEDGRPRRVVAVVRRLPRVA